MTIDQRELDFRAKVNLMIAFTYELRKEFTDYWTEPNKSGTKLKFEMEKTWDLNRRLRRWQLMGDTRKDFYGHKPVTTSVKPPPPKPSNMIEELDQLLEKYTLHPTELPFLAFSKYYEYMKAEKLIRPFTGAEVIELRNIYGEDDLKCRAACVQMTMDGYVTSGFTFQKVMELRKQLA